MKNFMQFLIFCLIFRCTAAYGQEVTSSMHGTINVLLADKNGAVLITDSRISHENPDRASKEKYVVDSDHAKKLFRLDDKTVCSIANFYSDEGPSLNRKMSNGFPALFLSVDALVTSFSEGLQHPQQRQGKVDLTVEQKADALAQYIGVALVELETEKRASSKYPGPTAFQQLIVVGYEANGTLTAVKRTVTVEPDDPNNRLQSQVHSKIEPGEVCHIGDGFCAILAGTVYIAQPMIDTPEEFAVDAKMNAYLLARQKHDESQMTVKDLEAFASHLKDVSEDKLKDEGRPVIGGDIQEATFIGGQVSMPPPKEPFKPAPPYRQPSFIINITALGDALLNASAADQTTVLINTVCSESGIMLDGTVLIGGKYDGCNLFFDGRAFYLDPQNVSMKAATLIIGPHTNDQVIDSAVASLPRDLEIKCWKDLPFTQDLQLGTFWAVGYSPDEDMEIILPPSGQVWVPLVEDHERVKAIHNAVVRCFDQTH